MPCDVMVNKGCLLVVRIAGKLAKSELEVSQKVAADVIQREGRARVLILAQTFDGWEEGGNWGELSFMMKYDSQIERIAIVGKEKWEDELLAFTGQGMRKGQVKYFPSARVSPARTWVLA
ncbi:MAG: STAS/SEC14 domain-containing protein [Acidobacteria bacterium]|nr:MAG: STAS/SEC14 domain-containing protein [Acidobacteriota bacterium]